MRETIPRPVSLIPCSMLMLDNRLSTLLTLVFTLKSLLDLLTAGIGIEKHLHFNKAFQSYELPPLENSNNKGTGVYVDFNSGTTAS